MFEVEIEQLKKFLTAQLPQAQPYVFLRDILAIDTIAASYKRFFTAEVDWWLYEEQNQWLDNHRFDTSAPEFTPIFKQLEDALRQNAHFDYDVLLSTIDTAAKVHLNFLCRPRTTLKWFVYRGDPTKTIYEILLRLEYLTDYAYLTKGFYAWARKTYTDYPSMDLLSVVEFEKIIETIDNEHILDLSPHQFVDLLLPLFEFFNRTTTNQNTWTVPTESLIIFLDDKKVVLIAKELERLLYDENIEQISQDQFLEVVVNILSLVDSGDLQPDYQVIEFENESENEKVSDSIIETHESELDATVQDHDEEIEYDEASENEELQDSDFVEISNNIPIDQSDVNADDAAKAGSEYEGDSDGLIREFIEDLDDNDASNLLDNQEVAKEISVDDISKETTDFNFEEEQTDLELANEEIPSEANLFSETDEINSVDEGDVELDVPDTVEHRMNVHSFVDELPEVPVSANGNEEFHPSEIEAELPFIEMDVEIPQVENEVEIPSIEVGDEIPTVEADDEIPTDEADEEIPTDEADEEITTDEADDEINAVQPDVEISTAQTEDEILPFEMDDEIPTVEIHEEIPFAEMEEEIPTVEMEEEIPSVDMETEIPIDEMDIDIPVVEPDREIITELIVNKVLAAEPELLRWETIIDSKQKEKFVKKMFDGNEAAYHKLLGELDDCHSWAKADAAIVRYLIRARKKHTDSIVIEFGNTIQKRFLENQ